MDSPGILRAASDWGEGLGMALSIQQEFQFLTQIDNGWRPSILPLFNGTGASQHLPGYVSSTARVEDVSGLRHCTSDVVDGLVQAFHALHHHGFLLLQHIHVMVQGGDNGIHLAVRVDSWGFSVYGL